METRGEGQNLPTGKAESCSLAEPVVIRTTFMPYMPF